MKLIEQPQKSNPQKPCPCYKRLFLIIPPGPAK